MILACGTAYHAGLVGRYAIEAWAGVPCDAEVASEWRYRDPQLEEGTLVIGISQSGETADTLAALRLARERGARTVAITNSPGSQITREVDAVLYTHAGLEIGVAATKTFTSQVALMSLLGCGWPSCAGRSRPTELQALMGELRGLPHKLVRCLETQDGSRRSPSATTTKPFFFYLGRHVGLPVCLEGALKLKEISYIPTEAYAAGEMKHGPIALLDDGDAGRMRRDALARVRQADVEPAGGPGARRAGDRRRHRGRRSDRRRRRRRHVRVPRRTRCCSRSSRSSPCSCSPTGSRGCAATTSTSRATSQRR